MYENMTFLRILKRMLDRVPEKYDRREGSIIYDGCAPAAFELAEAYIMARVILKETFATTASREYLILRAAEFNIIPEEATPAEVECKFSQAVSLGTRFSADNVNFIVSALLDDVAHTYKLTCETAGIIGNNCIGTVIPIDPMPGLATAEITKVITQGEDEEDTEIFRRRYFAALKSKAYGGNGADYKEKVLALPGIGGVKVYRCWAGGGTVKLVILNSSYEIPDSEFVNEIQQKIDPTPQGQGYGIAPIGHTVTVAMASAVKINIIATISLKSGYSIDDVRDALSTAVSAYLTERRKEWCEQNDTEQITVRVAYILTAMLSVPNVTDITEVTANGQTDKVVLQTDEVPTVGTITLKAGVV